MTGIASYKVPEKEIQFAMKEVLEFFKHYSQLESSSNDRLSDLQWPDEEFATAILSEAAKFAEEELVPLNAIGDDQGCRWHANGVETPPGFKAAYKTFVENGWPAIAQNPKLGGQGLPMSLQMVLYEIIISANMAWGLYPTTTWGAITTIETHGTKKIKNDYLPNLISGAWTATMCLTESHCGSDLGLLRTKAEPCDDGSYSISGTKIFISSGDHDFADNIVHLVLARLPDSPAGTGGISLFVVPKKINSNSNPNHWAEANGVSCGSIEEKMGLHGNATCVMNFDGAKGYLLGQVNRGLNAMFTFINESRVDVCLQALGQIERSYQGALAYAKEREQMRGNPRFYSDKPADPIIVHPEIRKLLMTQRCFAEGARLLAYDLAKKIDVMRCGGEAGQQAAAQLSFLTPIAKGFITEVAVEATHHGIQLFGGHGYVQETGMEQYLRDVRITTIYEGTTAIQGLDLIQRKIMGDDCLQFSVLLTEMKNFCEQAEDLSELYQQFLLYVSVYQQTTADLIGRAVKSSAEANAAAVDYLMLSGYVATGYYLLRGAGSAVDKLSDDADGFYRSKIELASFYVKKIMPRIYTHHSAISAGVDCLTELSGEHFSIDLS